MRPRGQIRAHGFTGRLGSLALLLCCVGCVSPSAEEGGAQPAPLMHWVTMALVDASEVHALRQDCRNSLALLPSVVSYADGEPFDSGREGLRGEWHLLLCIGFKDDAAYQAYLEHPDHVALVDRWRSRLASLEILDAVMDPTPVR